MLNFLVEHARKKIWCSPEQDRQHILKPARLTAPEGVWNSVKVSMKRYPLPNTEDRFHVYQVGQLYPVLVGLFAQQNRWVPLTECCNTQRMVLDVYNDKGLRYPNNQVWYRFTSDRNLILAVAVKAKLPFNLPTENLYLRVYTPAYLASSMSDPANDYVYNEGKTLSDLVDLISFQTKVSTYRALPGQTYTFVNGFLTTAIDPFTAAEGDLVELLYDSTIYKVVDLPVRELPTFDSLLDLRRKYLVHYPEDATLDIDYKDDVDFFLYKEGTNARFQGVYYHKNQADAVRMVTHRDYAIQVPYVAAFADGISGWTDPEALVLRLYIRKSGYNRTLGFEHNRLHELYKLGDTDVQRALLGIDSTVPNWRADHLEQSTYSELMGYPTVELPLTKVETALGYNAIAKLIGDTPSMAYMESGQKVVDVPYMLQLDSTVFEYDQQGRLTGYYAHDVGDVYPCQSVMTRLVEILAGHARYGFDEQYGRTATLDPRYSYRMYRSPIAAGVKLNEWEDVTGSALYFVENNTLTWLVDPVENEFLVRSDRDFLTYNLLMQPFDGLLNFDLHQVQTIDGVEASRPMRIAPGEIDLFLNGRSLIEGLDYHIEFPRIVIRNKEYLIDPANLEQLITVRAKGFCKSDLTRETLGHYGFVQYGMLSRNTRFDLKDDKVVRLVLDGALIDRTDGAFTEDYDGVFVGTAENGKPYAMRDLIVPTRGLTPTETYTLRTTSRDVDTAVTNYLSLKHPEPVRTDVFTVTERYAVFSPLCCKLLHDLINGVLVDPRIKQHYNDTDILEICAPYMYLLAFDPCHDDNLLDDRFVMVHPHNRFTVIDVDFYQYTFLSRVVKLILRDRVNLSHFLRVL